MKNCERISDIEKLFIVNYCCSSVPQYRSLVLFNSKLDNCNCLNMQVRVSVLDTSSICQNLGWNVIKIIPNWSLSFSKNKAESIRKDITSSIWLFVLLTKSRKWRKKLNKSKKPPHLFFSCIVAIEIAVFVEISCDYKYKCWGVGQLLRSIAAGFLFNDILGFPDFKLTGLIWKAWKNWSNMYV